MFTKPLTRQALLAHDISSDLSVIHRLLVAAAVSKRFCSALLHDPSHAIQAGFGGEHFPLSEQTLTLLTCIRVSTLPEFVHQLDENLSRRLLSTEIPQASL